MTERSVQALGLDLWLLASFYLSWNDPELFLEPGENAGLVAAARLLTQYVGSSTMIGDPALEQALRPALAILARLAPDRFPPGLEWPRPLLLVAAEGARWIANETYNVRATPSALLRARDALGKLQATLAEAGTSRRLPDVAGPLMKANRALAEIAPVVTVGLAGERPTNLDWRQA